MDEWTFVPKAAIPLASAAVPTDAAELIHEPPTGTVASNVTTML